MSAAPRGVLFVDDAVDLLDGLRNGLRGQRKAWKMRFADGGEAALRLLEEEPAEIVITDMRMPGMDGLELLKRVQARWPETARVVLSGQADLSTVIRASAVAHQYLAKPCDMDVLRGVITRALETIDRLPPPPLRRALGQLGSLPVSPRLLQELAAALAKDDVDLRRLAPLAESDAGVAARLLQFANSPYCGLTMAVERVETALLSLGPSTVRQLLDTLEPLRAPLGGAEAAAAAALGRHALLAARLVRRLMAGRPGADAAYAAALLHQAGELVLSCHMADGWADVVRRAHLTGRCREEVEREVMGADHAQVAGYILGLWGLPGDVVEAVRLLHAHHGHAGAAVDGDGPLSPVLERARCAAWLAQEVTGHPDPALTPAEKEALARCAGASLDAWRGWAVEEARALGMAAWRPDAVR